MTGPDASTLAHIRGRSAKIIATLGPGSAAPDTIYLLAKAGVDIFRLNFSHGSHEDHKQIFDRIREVERRFRRPLAILADLQGPKIRVGTFPEGKIRLSFHGEYVLTAEKHAESEHEIPVPHPEILNVLDVGDEILLNDGQLLLRVLELGERPKVRAELPGILSDKKGFTVRGKALPVGAMTDKDREDLAFAMQLGVDMVALSFVQTVADIETAKALMPHRVPLIAKLEKPAAITHLEAIVDAADAVMVARGDLGVEFPSEQVPIIQRRIIRAARRVGRPVIVATQMLESMIEHAAPTRAETSDVATAIYQGADGVMLSAETAVGRHPATAVAIMDRIIKATERADDFAASMQQFQGQDAARDEGIVDVVARSVHGLARQHGTKSIAMRTGSFQRLARFSRVRGPVPVLYGSINPDRLRQAQLLWGVHPIAFEVDNASDWAEYLAHQAGLDGSVAYARWAGEGNRFAWEIGANAYEMSED